MSNAQEILDTHKALVARKTHSEAELERIRHALAGGPLTNSQIRLGVFCAGSVARNEVGSKSDIDLFVLAKDDNEIDENRVFSDIASSFPEDISALGSEKYQRVYPTNKLVGATGTPEDDSENLFTARMLLLLEGRSVFDDDLINDARKKVLEHYFRDSEGHDDFRPLFLLNDTLRYWRTLCLNYERKRNDPTQPWRKKNINLKFARLLTVFSTVLPIISEPLNSLEQIERLCERTPLERLCQGIDHLQNGEMKRRLSYTLDIYEQFLKWKESMELESRLEQEKIKAEIERNFQTFSDFFHDALTDNSIEMSYRKFLII